MINSALLAAGSLGAPAHVASAVQNASARTGIDFSYLLKQAQVESSFNTDIKAKTSSATGLYQFIDQTWLRMVDAHGAQYGKGDWANAITKGSDGRFHVADKTVRAEILNARTDADFSALMAGEFAAENKNIIKEKTGKDANATDLYMAHFLGAGGAATFLKAMRDNPLQNAALIFPSAAKSNAAVFYNKDGSARSLSQVYDKFAAQFGRDTVTVRAAPFKPILNTETPNVATDIAHGFSYRGSAASFTPTIPSPIQNAASSDLLSSPLFSLFTDRGADVDEEKGFFTALKDRIVDALALDA